MSRGTKVFIWVVCLWLTGMAVFTFARTYLNVGGF